MGMDVYGKKPISTTGKYFRASVWSWHPLWDYCADVAPELIDAGLRKSGHYNDGSGLDAKDAKALGQKLLAEIAAGRAAVTVAAYEAERKALAKVACTICAGTGKRLPVPQSGAGNVPCNGCQSTGKQDDWNANYPMSLERIEEFAVFLMDSGGFSID